MSGLPPNMNGSTSQNSSAASSLTSSMASSIASSMASSIVSTQQQMNALLAQAQVDAQAAQAAQAAAQLGAIPINSSVPSNVSVNSALVMPNGHVMASMAQDSTTTTTMNNGRIVQASSVPQSPQNARTDARRSEIYKFTSTKPLYAAAWSMKKAEKFRLAVGTVVDMALGNKVSIVQLNETDGELVERGSFQHEFPPNCIRFIPDLENNYPDLIATSADVLRLYRISPECIIQEEVVLSSNKTSQYTAPLTSFDWNEVDPRILGTSSIDTTCTIYDIETGQAIGNTRKVSFNVKTQLIAHDKPVHDIAFSKVHNGLDHFATVGADGSARMFDLRHLEHSTIVYEDPTKSPLMRIEWNKQEAYYLATFAQDSTEVVIIDIRFPCNPLTRLKNHNGAVNGLAWAPHSPHHICTAGDDAQALIWDIQGLPRPVEDPILAYSAGGEVNQVHWGAAQNNWISICFNKSLEILRV